MIFAFLLPAAAVWISGTILTIVHVRRAPVAVENEDGFQVLEETSAENQNPAFVPALRTSSG